MTSNLDVSRLWDLAGRHHTVNQIEPQEWPYCEGASEVTLRDIGNNASTELEQSMKRFHISWVDLYIRSNCFTLPCLLLSPIYVLATSQTAKPLESTSIRHRSDAFASDRCLTDIDTKVFAIWDVDDVKLIYIYMFRSQIVCYLCKSWLILVAFTTTCFFSGSLRPRKGRGFGVKSLPGSVIGLLKLEWAPTPFLECVFSPENTCLLETPPSVPATELLLHRKWYTRGYNRSGDRYLVMKMTV